MIRYCAALLLFLSSPLSAGAAPGAAASAVAGPKFATGVVDEREMRRVLAESDASTLVIFDIDNTLLTPCGHLGSDEWYDWLCERGVAAGLSHDDASKAADDAFNRWQGRVPLRSVDPAAPEVLAALRARGIAHFALTARSAGARDITPKQLRSLGLSMAFSAASAAPRALAALGPGSAYRDGIFFIGEGGITKGEAVLRILDAAGLKPSRIVFVDDKARNTATVDESLTKRGIPHLCLRFSRKDEEVRAFRSDMANLAELSTGRAPESPASR